MSQDQIIANAAAAAATPATGPTIDAVEQQRLEITKHPDWFGGGPEKPKLLERMRRLTSAPEVIAAEDQAKADAAAKLTPAQKELADLRNNPKLYDKHDPEQPKLAQRLKQLLAAEDTTEERQALADSGIEGARRLFNLDPPAAILKHQQADYEERFAGHEQDLLLYARSEGLDTKTVTELRDYGVEMGVRLDGQRMSADDEAAFRKAFTGRLSKDQQDLLVKFWKVQVEGGTS
jgi:hypothetical protein